MAGQQPHSPFASDLNIHDPNFSACFLLWANQQHTDTAELIAGTKETLIASRALLQEADRILAVR